MRFAIGPLTAIGTALAALFLASANADPARTVRGSVEGGQEGEPVWIGVFGDEAAEGTWTQAAGPRFEVALPPGGRATLVVVSKNRVPQTVAVADGSPATVRFAPGLALAGTVRSEDGARLADAVITIEMADANEFEVPPLAAPRWRSDSRGRFRIGGLRPGRHVVAFAAEGHVPLTLKDVQVLEGTAVNRIEAKLPTAHFIAGRVVNGDGAPVAGVEVHMHGGWTGHVTKTTVDGAYRLGPLPHGERVVVFARSPGLGSTAHHYEIVAPREGLVLVFGRRAILGRLVDETIGEPMHKARLTWMGRGELWQHEVEMDDGAFHVPLDEVPLEGEAHALVVQAPGHLPWFTRLTPDDDGKDLGEIALAPARSVSGRVVDTHSGIPIPGARVRGISPKRTLDVFLAHWLANHSPRAVSTADGTYALDALPLELASVRAYANGYGAKVLPLPPGAAHLDFALEASAQSSVVVIAGFIVRSDGTPVPGQVILFRAADAPSADLGFSTQDISHLMTSENGAFRFERRGLPDGAYVLVAGTDAGVVARRTVAIKNGQSVEDVRLVVKEGDWLRISVEGVMASERGASVIIRDKEDRTVFDSGFGNGNHRVSGVPEEAVAVATASVGGQRRHLTRKVRFGDDGEAAIRFDFTPRSRLTGTLTAGERPLGGVELRVVPATPSSPRVRTYTNRQGRYDVYGLAEGRHMVRTDAGHSFEVHVAQDTSFDIDLPAVSLAGAVRSTRTGRPISQTVVRLRRSDGHGDFTRTAADGSFRFDGLLAGEHVISVSEPGFESLSRELWIVGDEMVYLELAEAASGNDTLGRSTGAW